MIQLILIWPNSIQHVHLTLLLFYLGVSENYELEVLGEQIDAVINSLRKKLGQAQPVSVGPVDDAANNNTNSDTKS